ncbi:MAG: aminotransferase class III-fold pyridoxal phosphate-dependent enzyme, partial [Deltaproteobacteria bacterium]|nr:aminotransferase class III-fold pyridoxal phosphate-dependent enzyme [Deltaproteobacteria bacterium]
YIILSKALSGGLTKISAALIRSKRYRPEIGLLHTGTYNEDDLSCAVALKVLELIQENNGEVLRSAASKGVILENKLRTVQQKHPDIIRDIRGRGLMLGIEFSSQLPPSSRILQVLETEGMLGYVIAAYLFWEHRIRIAPTLSQPMTLRVEPSVLIPERELGRFAEAVSNVCDVLVRGDAATLTRFLGNNEKVGSYSKQFVQAKKAVCDKKIAWLFHLNTIEDVRHFDFSLASLDAGTSERLLRRIEQHPMCAVFNPLTVRSRIGTPVQFYPIFLPVTSARMKEAMDLNHLPPVKALIYHGIAKAKDLGCRVVSLGQYTSVVTANGYQARTQGIGVTTGNSLTVVLSVEALLRAARQRNVAINRSTLAVVGAGGNIGSTCASLLANQVDKLILVGSNKPNAPMRMERLVRHIRTQTCMDGRLESTTDLSRVREANLVISSVNSPLPILGSEHFRPDAIVCDISVPASVLPRLADSRTDMALFQGGVVVLPHKEPIDIPGFPLTRGYAFACMAEGMLLALEGIYDHSFTGPVSTEKVTRIQAFAEKHGFDLKEYKP